MSGSQYHRVFLHLYMEDMKDNSMVSTDKIKSNHATRLASRQLTGGEITY